MRKCLLMGAVLALTALLMLSCNKNRFDFNQIESVEGSGQWKLPIGSYETTLDSVLKQFSQNDMIGPGPDGNLQLSFSYQLNDVVKGSNFLRLGTLNLNQTSTLPNPVPGYFLPEPVDTTFYFTQEMKIDTDTTNATIESAVVKSGTMQTTIETNLGQIIEIRITSPDIMMESGDTLNVTSDEGLIDLAGATFRICPENGVIDSTLTIHYSVRSMFRGSEEDELFLNSRIGLNSVELKELCGHIDEFSFDFAIDTTFSLPLDNLDGQVSLVGTKIKIKEKNTFERFRALLQINQAELYGPNSGASSLFDHYPYVLDVIPTNTFHDLIPDGETINLTLNTDYDAFRFNGTVDFNPSGSDVSIVVHDTSSISLGVDAIIPLQFNIPNVSYIDTLDLNMGEISAPEFVEKIVLNMMFESQIPFNLNAQFFTFKSNTQQVTGALLDEEVLIKGSFDGNKVQSEATISITQDLLKQLLEADKLIMCFGVNTEGHDVYLNLKNGFGVTLKADVFYGGSLDFDNF